MSASRRHQPAAIAGGGPRRRRDRIRSEYIDWDPAHRERDGRRSHTKQRHDPKAPRPPKPTSGRGESYSEVMLRVAAETPAAW